MCVVIATMVMVRMRHVKNAFMPLPGSGGSASSNWKVKGCSDFFVSSPAQAVRPATGGYIMSRQMARDILEATTQGLRGGR